MIEKKEERHEKEREYDRMYTKHENFSGVPTQICGNAGYVLCDFSFTTL